MSAIRSFAIDLCQDVSIAILPAHRKIRKRRSNLPTPARRAILNLRERVFGEAITDAAARQCNKVELVGLPGAGKTTLWKRFHAKYPNRTIRLAKRSVGKINCAPWLVLRAPLYAGLLGCVLLSRNMYSLESVRRGARALRIYVETSRIRSQKTVIIDEGPTHALFAFMFGNPESRLSGVFERMLLSRIARYVSCFVYLQLPVADAFDRAVSRKKTSGSRFNSTVSNSVRHSFLHDKSYARLLQNLEWSAPGRTVTLDAQGSIDGLVSDLSRELELD